MGFPPEGGEKGMPSSILSPRVPQLPSIEILSAWSQQPCHWVHTIFWPMQPWKVPCWRWLYLWWKAGCDGRRYLAGRVSDWVSGVIPVLTISEYKNQAVFLFRLTLAIDRAFTSWTTVSMSRPHTSKNSTWKKKRSTGEKVHELQFMKFRATVGGFLWWVQTDTVRG